MTTIIPFIPRKALPGLPRLPRATLPPEVYRLPVLQHGISAGFPSPADDYIEKTLDLNSYLVATRRRPSSFA